MNYLKNIFLIFSIVFAINSAFAKANVAPKYATKQNIGLNDELQIEKKNSKTSDWYVESRKRKSNGNYMPLYDEFKRRLDSFNAGLIQNNDRQALNNENLYSQFADEIIRMRSNRGFLFGGTKTNSKEQESKKTLKQPKKYTKEQKTRLRRFHVNEQLKNKNKLVIGEVKPGGLYDEYKRQIKKANAAFA